MIPALDITGVSKDYRGLRPLRVARLSLMPGEQLAILGFDQPSAELFVNLLTGATLPDRGEVQVFGRPTHSIADSAEWLAIVDRFGIASERAVLLDQFSVVQNLAVPFTLEIDPPANEFRQRAEALAHEVGVPQELWERAVAETDSDLRARLRVARALALDPAVLLVEHLSADVARPRVPALGARVRQIARRRGIALLAVTADPEFAKAVADRVMTLDQATGRLSEVGRRGWLRARLG